MADSKKFEKKAFVKVLKVISTVCEVAGEFCPFAGLGGSIVKAVVGYLDDEEIETLKHHFETVHQGLDQISDEINQTQQQIVKECIQIQYGTTAENIRKQFCDFMEILDAEPGERDDKKQAFLNSYVEDGGTDNMDSLYRGVTKHQAFNLNILVPENSGSEEVKKALCTKLTYLFCIGLVAMMGYYAFKRDDLLSRYTEWEKKMNKVNSALQAYLTDCK